MKPVASTARPTAAESALLFQLGQATAVMVEPKSAASNSAQPVGTGPFKLESWAKGSHLVLTRWDGYRDVKSVASTRCGPRSTPPPTARSGSS